MKRSEQVKPISYLKVHTPKLIRGQAEGNDPVIIPLHGETKAVLQEIGIYEQTQEPLALLKLLAMGNRDDRTGRGDPRQGGSPESAQDIRPPSALNHGLAAPHPDRNKQILDTPLRNNLLDSDQTTTKKTPAHLKLHPARSCLQFQKTFGAGALDSAGLDGGFPQKSGAG